VYCGAAAATGIVGGATGTPCTDGAVLGQTATCTVRCDDGFVAQVRKTPS
jgi:hypothetical protein